MSYIPTLLIPLTFNIAIETVSWTWWGLKTTYNIGHWMMYGSTDKVNNETELEIHLLQNRIDELTCEEGESDYVLI